MLKTSRSLVSSDTVTSFIPEVKLSSSCVVCLLVQNGPGDVVVATTTQEEKTIKGLSLKLQDSKW